MNKRSIAKAFNEAKVGLWTTVTTEEIKLTNGSFEFVEESRQEINKYVDQYLQLFFTKAIQKKIIGLKTLVRWPSDESPFKPVVRYVEVLRISTNKYVMLIHVQ